MTMQDSLTILEAESTESFHGPEWDTSSEYPSFTSNEFTYDQAKLITFIDKIEKSCAQFSPLAQRVLAGETLNFAEEQSLVAALQATTELEQEATTLFWNLMCYANCESCIDGSDTEAQRVKSELTALSGKLEGAMKPASLFLARAPQAIVDKYLDHARTRPTEFQLKIAREQASLLLSESEETLLAQLNSNGPMAFGELYDQISSSLRCEVVDPTTREKKSMGLAQAAGLLRDENEAKRKAAWIAIQNAWETQEVGVTSVLNGIAGWRLTIDERRSAARGKDPVHFLDEALLQSRISKATLDAMMKAVESRKETAQRALRAMAAVTGKERVDLWDLLAPAPKAESKKIEFKEGLSLVREAFAGLHETAADFIDTMEKNRWIEGRVLPTKRPGAFCTGFIKSRTPRVYQTYMGSMGNVRTLAHELGHAYHSWVMRDIPFDQTRYPMTLAETASVFAETAFSDRLMAKAAAQSDHDTRFEIAWQNADSAVGFLLDIPSRYDFESSFYERRARGFVPTDELKNLSEKAFTKWYGDGTSESNRTIWTKLHFSIPTIRFYNFPYTFGYLFSLGVYAQREKLGADFSKSYTALLRDTGRMTAEEVARKHLNADLTRPEFWLASLDIVERQVREFEELAAARIPARMRQ